MDASYVTHTEPEGQIGAMISIGKGCVTSALKKQKINTTSSTIIEGLCVQEESLQELQTKDFLQNQGFEISKATLYQDNMRAMFLEKNGCVSSSIRTKHIDTKYFLSRTGSKGETSAWSAAPPIR